MSFLGSLWDKASDFVSHVGGVVLDTVGHVVDAVVDAVAKLAPSEYRTTVATTVSRVIEDSLLPSATRDGLSLAILENADFIPSVNHALSVSLGARADQMYRYADKHYTHGLPTGELFLPAQEDQVLTTVLRNLEGGAPVVLAYYMYGKPNAKHYAWTQLAQNHGYSPTTNEFAALSVLKGTKVYLDSMTLQISAQVNYPGSVLATWGATDRAGYSPTRKYTTEASRLLLPHTGTLALPGITALQALVTYAWEDPLDKTIQLDTFTVSLAGQYTLGDYFHAKYVVNGETKYFMYLEGAGTYPTLDSFLQSSGTAIGEFFPMLHFRQNGATLSGDKTSNAYKTSTKLAKFIGIDYAEMAKAIDTNPQIASVEQAFIMMAVPANTTNPTEQRYLYEFFDKQRLVADPDAIASSISTAYTEELVSGSAQFPARSASAIVIQDALFKMSLSNKGIFKKRIAGSIGPVGSYTSSRKGVTTDGTTEVYSHVYAKQITKAFYDEVTVLHLSMTYFIWQGHNSAANDGDATLLVPLDSTITKEFSVIDREELYARSLHYVFNSRNTQEVKWYQQEWFSAFMQVVAIVVAIIYPPVGGWTLTALATAAATAVLLPIVFRVVVKLVGPEVAMVLAIATLVKGGYQAFQGTAAAASSITAGQLLGMSAGLTNGIAMTVQEDMQLLQGEISQYAEEAKARTDILKAAEKALNEGGHKIPFFIPGETPTEYFQVRVHSGNIGTFALDTAGDYVENALALPRLQQTLGEKFNAN